MIREKQLRQLRQMLQSRFPLLGKMRRQRAVEALQGHRNDPAAIEVLVEAMTSSDREVTAAAEAALGDLSAQPAIDALGALWAKGRDTRLGKLIAQHGYIARQPLQAMILTSLKCGRPVRVDRADVVPFFVRLLNDAEEEVRTAAIRSLEHVAPGPAWEALCDEAMKKPSGKAAQLCLQNGIRPRDPERRCLFLFVTRQLDEYFNEDFEFQHLRPQYDRADATIQAHVMEVVRSGDRRCQGFFGTRAKPLPECTEPEIKLALESCLRHQDWARLFQACLELPLKYGFPAIKALRKSNWEPDSPDLRSVYRQVLADAGDEKLPPPKKPSAASPLFEQWLVRGRGGELARLDEASLRERLKTATPPDSVAIVGAMAAKGRWDDGTVRAVRESPHWLVRLAGYATGISGRDLTRDSVGDTNYWINELSSVAGVLESWPGKATPADLERLSAAPAEAWTGKLGSVRKVLRTIMTHRITTGTFEPMVIEAGEFAGEFVEATEVEFETDSGRSQQRSTQDGDEKCWVLGAARGGTDGARCDRA